MPCAQDRSCFEERSCQSGLGLLSACGVGGWESCAFPQLHSRPPAWDPRARLPGSCCRRPAPSRAAAERAVPLGHGRSLVCACAGPERWLSLRGWLRAGARALHPRSGGRARTPALAPPRFSGCTFLRAALVATRLRLLMLNALIRRDKTALKIPRCRPPAGARGLPGAGGLGRGAAGEFRNSSSSKWL